MDNLESGGYQLTYEILLVDRKSMSIAVHPDKSVVVKAPLGSTSALIAAKVKQKARWIKRQIAYFDQFDPRTPARKYVAAKATCTLAVNIDCRSSWALAIKCC